MGRGRRVLRILKWALAVWCLLLVVAWPVSAWRDFGGSTSFGDFYFTTGSITIFVDRSPMGHSVRWFSLSPPDWSGNFDFGSSPVAISISIPIWFALLLSAALTYLLIRLDCKRIPPGHCKSCGYDLTGNALGRCPECREAIRGDA